MIINNADDGTYSNDFQYYVTSANGQEVRAPLQRGHYHVVQAAALGPAPYTVLLDASPSFKAEGIQSADACITYYPPANKALVTAESR
jgi:hypothetical protein